VTGELLSRAWAAGAGPGDGPLVVDVDSTICGVHGYHKQGACYGYSHRLGYHPLLATRADSGEVLHARLRKGAANTARGILRFVDELVARLRRAGAVGEQRVAKTLRRTLLALPGRLTRSGRRWTLHLPAGWPWAHSFTMALAQLRCIPYPT
jgi:hypothetical protein